MKTPVPQPSKPSSDKVRSPVICVLSATGWFLASSHCFHLNRLGSEWAGFAGMIGSGLGFRELFQALYHRHKLLRVRRQDKQYRESGKAFANARFSTAKDFKRAKLLRQTGVVLASVTDAQGRKHIVRDNGEKLILLLGQAGANKTTSTIIPTLLPTKPLSHRKHDGLGHSAVVNDPAGEAYAVCKRALEAAGYRVIAISPWASLMSERLGVPVEDVGFNVWSELNNEIDSAEWESLVADKSELFIMNRPQDDSQS